MGGLPKHIGVPNKKPKIELNNIEKRCLLAKKKNINNSPWCLLKNMYDELPHEDLKIRLRNVVDELLKIYKRKLDYGVLPKLIDLSLSDTNKTISDLETVVEFFKDGRFSHKVIKKSLYSLNNEIPNTEELEKLFSIVKGISNTEYEDSFHGDEFKTKRTSLSIGHRCSDLNTDDKLFNLIKNIQDESKPEELDLRINNLTKDLITCIKKSLRTVDKPVKSDLELIQNLYVKNNGEKELIFPIGNYEVKKLDPYADSYLSEFFSIFKESSLRPYKQTYIDTYNKIVGNIYNSIKGLPSEFDSLEYDGKLFLKKVKENLNGMIFHKNLIVPIEYIEFYWSDKSRGTANEKRLCIRYRLKNLNNIKIYKYTKGSDIVELLDDKKTSGVVNTIQ
jgi:hypothetical protein